ncbi:MAG: hypothetical protein ACFHU9_02375 [Fluviicola sp.]
MRAKWILLIAAIMTSLIAWNSIDFSDGNQNQTQQAAEEQLENESSSNEEGKEDEHLETIEIYFVNSILKNSNFEATASFCYCFSINSYCKEPEVYPPRC